MNLFKQILTKIFCHHDWKTHRKTTQEINRNRVVEGTKDWYKPIFQSTTESKTTEILVCKECGKITKIEY